MTPRAIVVLGIGQCVNWGVLYYAFAVLLLPVEATLGVPRWVVTGAFSLALLTSALAAPTVGRWCDRGHGADAMLAGGLAASVLLAGWAALPSLLTLYVAWLGLGLCMAATLYETAFAIVGRTHAHPTERLRALAAVTVFGGLASTVFLPVTALLVRGLGWRGAVAALACVLAVSTGLTWALALRARPREPASVPSTPGPVEAATDHAVPRFAFVLLVFALASLASAAVTANLVPALGEREVSPTTAAVLGGLLGVMQLPGRALLMRGTLAASPPRLVIVSLVLQGSGLAALATAASTIGIGAGIAIFAVGAGLSTLVRPHLVQTLFTFEGAGYLNGRLAQSQQLARAAGPIVAAWAATFSSYRLVFLLLAAMFGVLAIASRSAFDRAPG